MMGFYVISEDGTRYGPADITSLALWVKEGRILPNMVLEEEFTGARLEARQLPELAVVFQTMSSVLQNNRSARYRSDSGSRTRAILALVFGILGLWTCLFGIVAIVVGKAEIKNIERGLSPPNWRGLAVAGYVLGLITSLIWAGAAVVYFVLAMLNRSY